MSLAHSILGFLNYEKITGYDLAKAFQSSVQFFWHAQKSQIYPALNALEEKGFAAHETIVQKGRPNKKLYCITEKGREELFRWLSGGGVQALDDFKSAFLVRVFFSGNTEPEQGIRLFARFLEDCEKALVRMESIPADIERYAAIAPGDAPLYWQFTAEFGYSYLKMCIAWAESCIAKLEEIR